MSLFNLTSINFDSKQPNIKTGSNLPLNSGTYASKYNVDTYRYPIDLGSSDKGHYIIIHINVQDKTQYESYTGTLDNPTIVQNRINNGTPTLYSSANTVINGASSVIDFGQKFGGNLVKSFGGSDIVNGISSMLGSSGLGNIFGTVGDMMSETIKNYGEVRGARTIKRTTDTIALYMPNTLNFSNSQQYPGLSIDAISSAVLAGGASIVDTIKGHDGNNSELISKFIKNLTPFVTGSILSNTDIGKVAFATNRGMVVNPNLELIYSSPDFREFQFEFMFYPRSSQEAQEVQKIINRLYFHQAPELRKEYNSFLLVPPSEFDIQFYHDGKINPNIPQISTCVLTSINADYAPEGFQAYEVPNQDATMGGTGMPVAIRLTLNFKETEIMTKDNFAKDAHSFKLGSAFVSEDLMQTTTLPVAPPEVKDMSGVSMTDFVTKP